MISFIIIIRSIFIKNNIFNINNIFIKIIYVYIKIFAYYY